MIGLHNRHFYSFLNGSAIDRLGGVVHGVEVQVVVEGPVTIRSSRDGVGIFQVSSYLGDRGRGGGGGRWKFFIGAELEFEAEIGVIEEEAAVVDPGTAYGELEERVPAYRRRVGCWVGEIGDDGGDGGITFGFVADGTN